MIADLNEGIDISPSTTVGSADIEGPDIEGPTPSDQPESRTPRFTV